MRLNELAESLARYGYRRPHILLQRESWQVTHKRIFASIAKKVYLSVAAARSAAAHVDIGRADLKRMR